MKPNEPVGKLRSLPFWVVVVAAFLVWAIPNEISAMTQPPASTVFCGDHNWLEPQCVKFRRESEEWAQQNPQTRGFGIAGTLLGLVSCGMLAGVIVFMIHANLAERDGTWWPYTAMWSGRYFMRRRISGKWEYRLPTDAEVDEHHEGGHPI